MKKIPLIIDADIGVDDCLAICLSQSLGAFDLRAITSVMGNVEVSWTTRNALFLKQELNLSCNVAKGADRPVRKPYSDNAALVHGKEGLADFKIPKINEKATSTTAWDLIYQEAVRAKNKLQIVAIGPLTNLAIAVEKYPDLPNFVDKLYVMGGGTFGNRGAAEFNIWVDPDAADRVFKAFEVHMVGLDACYKVAFKESDLNELINMCTKNALLKAMFSHLKSCWLEKGFDTNVPYDPLALACAFDDSLVTWGRCCVKIDTDLNSVENGRTVIHKHNTGEHITYVAENVDRDRFYTLIRDMVLYFNKA